MTSKKLRYIYRQDREGVNNVWIIVDTKTNRDIACAIYWDADTEWTKRTEANIRLIVEALNAYPPARHRGMKTKPSKKEQSHD